MTVRTTKELWDNLQRQYVAEVNKCAILKIDPLNSNSEEVDSQLLRSLIFVHKHLFENNGLSTLKPGPLREKNRPAKRTSKLFKDICQSETALKLPKRATVVDQNVLATIENAPKDLEKENCLKVLNVHVLDIPAGSLRSK